MPTKVKTTENGKVIAHGKDQMKIPAVEEQERADKQVKISAMKKMIEKNVHLIDNDLDLIRVYAEFGKALLWLRAEKNGHGSIGYSLSAGDEKDSMKLTGKITLPKETKGSDCYPEEMIVKKKFIDLRI